LFTLSGTSPFQDHPAIHLQASKSLLKPPSILTSIILTGAALLTTRVSSISEDGLACLYEVQHVSHLTPCRAELRRKYNAPLIQAPSVHKNLYIGAMSLMSVSRPPMAFDLWKATASGVSWP